MDESSFNLNRRARRSNVLLSATIETSAAAIPVKLRNLSTEGALIEGEGLPLEGSDVVFHRNELSVASRVAWVHNKQAGVAFQSPIAPEEVLRNIPKPRYRAPPDFRRPSLACRELTADELRLAETWATTSGRGSLGE